MKKIFFVSIMSLLISCAFLFSKAEAMGEKILVGNVIQINGNHLVFSGSSGIQYDADSGAAVLLKKNGNTMKISEVLFGDKIQVVGVVGANNNITALRVRNLSLYSRVSKFEGKITGLYPLNSNLVIDSKEKGVQNIQINSQTVVKRNAFPSTLSELEVGMNVSVLGWWERTPENVLASQVVGTLRSIKIDFVGSVVLKSEKALTIAATNNTLYGVDVVGSRMQTKNGKSIDISEISTGDKVHVWGRHVSGRLQVSATKVIDSSLTK